MLDHAVAASSFAGDQAGSQAEAVSPAALIIYIERMLVASRPAAARPLLQALKRIDPDCYHLALLEARTLLAEGQVNPALSVLDATIAHPAEGQAGQLVDMYLLRGQIQVGLGRFAQAIDDTAAAVMLDPKSALPKLRLGVLLVQLGHFDEAITCLREAAAGHEDPAAMRGLAMAYERAGRPDEAAKVLADSIATWPKDLELRAASVMLPMRLRRFDDAVIQARLARQDGAIDAALFALMGDALAYLGRHAEAADAYDNALKYAPGDLFLQKFAAISNGADGLDRAAPVLSRGLFDLGAPDYDNHVVARAYRVPGLIRRALQYQIAAGARVMQTELVTAAHDASSEGDKRAAGPVLDLGCGTGLVGLAIAPFAGPITGYDLSPVMLAAARLKRVYDTLHEGDMLSLLADDDRSWPLIVAGDSLLYFGRLEPILAGVCTRLAPGGRFIFSLAERRAEQMPSPTGEAGWALTRAGTYVHSPAYLDQALAHAGLALDSMEPEILHHEAEVPVPGWIIVARHAAEAPESLA